MLVSQLVCVCVCVCHTAGRCECTRVQMSAYVYGKQSKVQAQEIYKQTHKQLEAYAYLRSEQLDGLSAWYTVEGASTRDTHTNMRTAGGFCVSA